MTVAKSTIKHVALGILSRRDHARDELKCKLHTKFPDSDCVIEDVLDDLAECNYIDDLRFAELYCRYRSKKGFGVTRIAQELSQKKIDQNHIDCALFGPDSPDWFELASFVLAKKYKAPAADFKLRQKQKQFLYYRGFNQEQINHAVSQLNKPL